MLSYNYCYALSFHGKAGFWGCFGPAGRCFEGKNLSHNKRGGGAGFGAPRNHAGNQGTRPGTGAPV